MQTMEDETLLLKQRKLRELARRLHAASFMVVGLWLAVSIAGRWYDIQPILFAVCILLIVIYTLYRRKVTREVFSGEGASSNEIVAYTKRLRIICSASPFFWGITTAYIYVNPEFSSSREITLAVQAFMVGTYSVSYSIDRKLGRMAGFMAFGPVICALIYCIADGVDHSREQLFLIAVLALGSIYLIKRTEQIAGDFEENQMHRLSAERQAEKMHEISKIDALTQLSNRMHFDDVLTEAWDFSLRNRSSLTLFLIDLDYFKSINDKLGHLAGDDCLVHAAKILKKSLRQRQDCLARYGGEEFVVLIKDVDHSEAKEIGERLLNGVRDNPIHFEGCTVKMTCSIGVASVFPHKLKSMSQLISKADTALYKAKDDGRDLMRFASSD